MKIADAKSIPLDQFILYAKGLTGKLRAGRLWYCSPYRNENSPSFALSRDRMAWYDHGVGEGGNIIDLAMRLAQTDDVATSLRYIETSMGSGYIIQPPRVEFKKMEPEEPHYEIVECAPFEMYDYWGKLTPHTKYLASRGIDVAFVSPYLNAIKFKVKNDVKKGVKDGFAMKNLSGGFETRSDLFRMGYLKTTVGEKDISVIEAKDSSMGAGDAHKKHWHVFYSMMDFLTFLSVDSTLTNKRPAMGEYNYMVIHGDAIKDMAIAYFKSAKPSHANHYIHQDKNFSGQRTALDIMGELSNWGGGDMSHKYEGYKDLSEWHMDKQGLLYMPSAGISRPAPRVSPKLKP
jgi:hypothetical protein